MAKIYSKKIVSSEKMKPKKDVISFLLNYSKALNILKTRSMTIEIISN